MRLTKMLLGLLAVLLAMPCLGEEIVIFKSGQTIPIISHEIRDGMVHVDLGENAFVAFPEATIDAIEVAGKNVMIKPSYVREYNRRVPTTAGSYPVKPVTRRPGYEILTPQLAETENSSVKIDEQTGMAVYYPMSHSTGANKRRMGVTGDLRALGNNKINRGDGITTFGGTTPMGTNHVIGGLAPRRSNNSRQPNTPQGVRVKMKPGVANGTRLETPPEPDRKGKKDN